MEHQVFQEKKLAHTAKKVLFITTFKSELYKFFSYYIEIKENVGKRDIATKSRVVENAASMVDNAVSIGTQIPAAGKIASTGVHIVGDTAELIAQVNDKALNKEASRFLKRIKVESEDYVISLAEQAAERLYFRFQEGIEELVNKKEGVDKLALFFACNIKASFIGNKTFTVADSLIDILYRNSIPTENDKSYVASFCNKEKLKTDNSDKKGWTIHGLLFHSPGKLEDGTPLYLQSEKSKPHKYPPQIFKTLSEAQMFRFDISKFDLPLNQLSETQAVNTLLPKVTSAGLDLGIMRELLVQALPKLEAAKGKDIVLMIGNSRVGKTALLVYLLGYNLKRKMLSNGDLAVDLENPPHHLIDVIGHGESKTLMAEVYENNGLALGDTGGFYDLRHEEERTCVALTRRLLIKSARSIKAIIVVIDHSCCFTTSNQTGLRVFAETFAKFMIDPDKIPRESIIFAITKQQPHITLSHILASIELVINTENSIINRFKSLKANTEDIKTLEEVRASAMKLKILNLMKECKDRIVLTDVLAPYTRTEILNKLPSTNFITGDFKTLLGEADDTETNRLNEVIYEIAQRGALLFRELIEVSNHYYKCIEKKERQFSADEGIPFYDAQIKRFQEGENIDNKAEIEILESKRKQNLSIIEAYQIEIKQIQEEIEQLTPQLQTINTAEPIPYEKLVWKDKRAFLVGWLFGYTNETREYKGVPFIEDKIEKYIANGKIKDKVCKPSEGHYEATYTSDRGKDGDAYVQLCIEMRNHPENKLKINEIQAAIKKKSHDIENIRAEIGSKNKENETFNRSIVFFEKSEQSSKESRGRKLEDLEKAKSDCLKSITYLEKEVHDAKNRCEQIEAKIKPDIPLYKAIKFIVSIMPFNSSIVDAFIRQYAKYEAYQNRPPENIKAKFNNIGQGFYCTLTKKTMQDPVVAECGHSFERSAITKYLETKKECPTPNCGKCITNVSPNTNLKEAIKQAAISKMSASPLQFFKEPHTPKGKQLLEKKKELESRKKKLELELEEISEQLKLNQEEFEKENDPNNNSVVPASI